MRTALFAIWILSSCTGPEAQTSKGPSEGDPSAGLRGTDIAPGTPASADQMS